MDRSTYKRIVLATGIYPPEEGGPATYSKLLHDKLPEEGFVVEVYPFRTVRRFPRWLRHFLYFLKLWRAAFGADIVYAQDTVSVGFPALLAAKLSFTKFIIRVPGDYAWEQGRQRYGIEDSIDDFQNKTYGLSVEFLRRIQKFVVSRADRVITPSLYFRDVVREWVSKKERVVTIYNGVDFQELAVSVNTYIPKTLITAGRLVPWKGFVKVIELMEELPDWKLYIAGEGPFRKVLEDTIEKRGLRQKVYMLGSVPRKGLAQRIKEAEIFILNTHFESFSFQVVEVMNLGTPVITTDVGNLREIIEDKKEGILIQPDNMEQMKASIAEIHTNEHVRKQYVESAYRKSKEFSIENTIQKTASLIRDLI